MLEQTDSAVQKYREVGKDEDVCLKTDPYMCNVTPTICLTHWAAGYFFFQICLSMCNILIKQTSMVSYAEGHPWEILRLY